MKISAPNGVTEAETLSETLKMYRDLSNALRRRITVLQSNGLDDNGNRYSVETMLAHFKALQTVMNLEECLAEQAPNGKQRGVEDLDLDSARAEISSRLSVWNATRQS
ncbi:hypothetical protein [Amaricoccus macauensis]|uniref:hypothetical protein n=1 Tax=Amaricoccus macauensis TaxID=57001 RepID=UPI003C7D17F3